MYFQSEMSRRKQAKLILLLLLLLLLQSQKVRPQEEQIVNCLVTKSGTNLRYK